MTTRINLNIEAGSAGELQEALRDLANVFGGEGAGDDTGAEAAPAGRRGRPRKPAEPATPPSGDPPATGGAASGQTAPTAADLLGDADTGKPTKDAVTAAMKAALASNDPLTLQEGLKALTPPLPGRLSEMTEDQYPAALAYFKSVVALD